MLRAGELSSIDLFSFFPTGERDAIRIVAGPALASGQTIALSNESLTVWNKLFASTVSLSERAPSQTTTIAMAGARSAIRLSLRCSRAQKKREVTMAVSRRQLIKTAATFATAVGSAAFAVPVLADSITRTRMRSAAGVPVSKQDAQYQDQPKGEQRCSSCTNFQAPSACLVVEGTVTPNGWCKLFKAKSA